MTVLSPPRVLGATGQQLSARLLRLTDAAKWRPSGTGLAVVSGVVHGPVGQMGEVTLVNPTTVNVNPFLAVVQGTHALDQGVYEVPNDAAVTLTVTAQHASQFRRSLILVEVNDSQALGVASSATTDRARLHILDGALSSTSPGALPAVPANALALGEVAIPPAGQTVTLTPYNPRTTTRNAILPVVDDASTVTGHGAAPGTVDGQYRDHPVYGLQRWSTTAGTWRVAADRTIGDAYLANAGTVITQSPSWTNLTSVVGSSSGGPVAVRWSSTHVNGSSGVDRLVDVEIDCDGVYLGSFTFTVPLANLPRITRAAVYVHSPAAGSHTWTLRSRCSSSGAAVIAEAGTLVVVEKRA